MLHESIKVSLITVSVEQLIYLQVPHQDYIQLVLNN
jgi:hypothetical protein